MRDLGHPPIVLASGSPRRKALLEGLGLNFEVVPADIDEALLEGERPEAMVRRLAEEKVQTVAKVHHDALVIAADTTVVLDGEMLLKPGDMTENRSFIRRLAGRDHHVFTGHALVFKGQLRVAVEATQVTFRDVSEDEIARFVATGEGLDKAGGYAIQGYGAAFITRIEGCYFNVVGLSVTTVVMAAKALGVDLV